MRKILANYKSQIQELPQCYQYLSKLINKLELNLKDMEYALSPKLKDSISDAILSADYNDLVKLTQLTKDIADPAFIFQLIRILEDSEHKRIVIFAGKSHTNNISRFLASLNLVAQRTKNVGVPMDYEDYYESIPESVGASELAEILGVAGL